MVKICRTCNVEKPFDDYYKSKKGTPALDCKPCSNKKRVAKAKEHRENNRELWRERYRQRDSRRAKSLHKNYTIKSRFGIDLQHYEQLLASQNGGCGICGTTELPANYKYFSIDHCHNTGKVRGLLCSDCNSGLGFLKDNAEIVLKAYTYLIKNS